VSAGEPPPPRPPPSSLPPYLTPHLPPHRHFANGIWGCIAAGLFSAPELMATVYGKSQYEPPPFPPPLPSNSQTRGRYAGWFYQWVYEDGRANLLYAEAIGVIYIIGW
jgi:ammonia channel protein AmtB